MFKSIAYLGVHGTGARVKIQVGRNPAQLAAAHLEEPVYGVRNQDRSSGCKRNKYLRADQLSTGSRHMKFVGLEEE